MVSFQRRHLFCLRLFAPILNVCALEGLFSTPHGTIFLDYPRFTLVRMMASLDYLESEEYPPDLSEERLISLVSQIKVSSSILTLNADPPRSQLTIHLGDY